MKLKKTIFLLFLMGLFMSIAAIGSAASQEIDNPMVKPWVRLTSNLVFSQPPQFSYGYIPLKMDVLQPIGVKKTLPAVVYATGGAYMSANKDNFLQQRLIIAEAGYVVFSIEYRVAPQSVFPAQLEDMKSAIRYIRANAARFNVDADRIAVMGQSAGGHLAAMAGTTNGLKQFDKGENLDQRSDVQAVIDMFGPTDLTKSAEGLSEQMQKSADSPANPSALFVNGPAFGGPGGSLSDNPEKTAATNPITYITKDAPPFLIMHGDTDVLVSYKQSQLLDEALISKGVYSKSYIVKGAGHNGPAWHQPAVIKIVVDFLNENLKPKNGSNENRPDVNANTSLKKPSIPDAL